MKSKRQRRLELKKRRLERRERRVTLASRDAQVPADWRPVDPLRVNLGNSYSSPPAYYKDVGFRCVDCGKAEVWTAGQQKWWYEEIGGYFFTTARRCRPCRIRERIRKREARRVHLQGIEDKLARTGKSLADRC